MERNIYIDGRLKSQIDKKVIPDLKTKDEDCVFVVDGKEGVGKSVFAMGIGYYISSQLGTKYDIKNICFKPDKFREKIMSCPDKSVVIYDEAHRGMASARALSEVNNILKDLMMEMRQKNLLVIVVLPTFFLLDRYIALFRAKGVFHIYKRKRQRGFWVYFNERRKLKLYIKGKKEFNYSAAGRWPRTRGRFYNQYGVDETEYRAEKKKAFTERVRTTKAETYIKQRNILMWVICKKLKKTSVWLSKELKNMNWKLTGAAIRTVLIDLGRKMEEKEEEERSKLDLQTDNEG